jgi:hypothetical protein
MEFGDQSCPKPSVVIRGALETYYQRQEGMIVAVMLEI